MRCTACGSEERHCVRHSKLLERNGVVIVVRDVPMEECSHCETRWLTADTARTLDQLFPLLRSAQPGSTIVREWDDLTPTAA
ncbi:MAG: YgiT-type zinc finger protein [Microthrixaceae bacterium]|nr:YgiT-type zinc finger protein [Microthrixaceae bacterium]